MNNALPHLHSLASPGGTALCARCERYFEDGGVCVEVECEFAICRECSTKKEKR